MKKTQRGAKGSARSPAKSKTKSGTKFGAKSGTKSGTTFGANLSAGSGKGVPNKPATRPAKARFPVRGAPRKSSPKARPSGDARGPRPGRDAIRTRDRDFGGAGAPVPRIDLPEVRALAIEAMDAALDKKALAPVLIDVSAMASYTDFIGIVSGRSDRQVDAIAENVCQVMKARGRRVLGQEGGGNGRWTLLDFGSFVIHVFHHPVREFYDLESLWIEAPRVKLDVPAESALTQHDVLYGAP